MFGSGTTPVFSNDEINDIVKTVKCLQNTALLIKGFSETVKNEVKEQNGGFFGMFAAYQEICQQVKEQ